MVHPAPAPQPEVPDAAVALRQCGRCRLHFDGDPELPPDVRPDWWACPPCREVLLGHGPRIPTRPLERAQTVWQAALASDGLSLPADQYALELLRVAHRDAATMAHALVIGRTRLVSTPDDETARRAVTALETAIAFLGVRGDPGALPRPTPTSDGWGG